MPEKKILFGRGYEWDSNKTPKENWEGLRKYEYKHRGIDIGEMPPLDEKEDEKLIKTMMPELDKMIEEVKRQNKTL